MHHRAHETHHEELVPHIHQRSQFTGVSVTSAFLDACHWVAFVIGSPHQKRNEDGTFVGRPQVVVRFERHDLPLPLLQRLFAAKTNQLPQRCATIFCAIPLLSMLRN